MQKRRTKRKVGSRMAMLVKRLWGGPTAGHYIIEGENGDCLETCIHQPPVHREELICLELVDPYQGYHEEYNGKSAAYYIGGRWRVIDGLKDK